MFQNHAYTFNYSHLLNIVFKSLEELSFGSFISFFVGIIDRILITKYRPVGNSNSGDDDTGANR